MLGVWQMVFYPLNNPIGMGAIIIPKRPVATEETQSLSKLSKVI